MSRTMNDLGETCVHNHLHVSGYIYDRFCLPFLDEVSMTAGILWVLGKAGLDLPTAITKRSL